VRVLEAAGLPTVVIGNARDIVETCGVARFVFLDSPLGNPCGEPFNASEQRWVVRSAVELLASARGPRTTLALPYRWAKGEAWKEKIFSKEQPFLEGEAEQRWLESKEKYKELKAKGAL